MRRRVSAHPLQHLQVTNEYHALQSLVCNPLRPSHLGKYADCRWLCYSRRPVTLYEARAIVVVCEIYATSYLINNLVDLATS